MAYLLDYDVSASTPGHLSPRAQKTTRKSWFLNMWKERNARHQRPKCLKSVLPPAKAFTFAVRTAQFICGWVGTYALIEYFLAPHYVLLGSQEKRTKGIQTIKIRSMAPIVPRLVRKVLVLSNHVSSHLPTIQLWYVWPLGPLCRLAYSNSSFAKRQASY